MYEELKASNWEGPKIVQEDCTFYSEDEQAPIENQCTDGATTAEHFLSECQKGKLCPKWRAKIVE